MFNPGKVGQRRRSTVGKVEQRSRKAGTTVQILLGHGDLETTAKYLHLSQRHLRMVSNPLEDLTLSSVEESRRAFRRPQKP
jgi:hypothetical protein